MSNIPKLYETDGIRPDDKLIYQVWYLESVNFVWCIAELDESANEAFGYANLNSDIDAEWGYIDIADIKKNGAKLTHTKPTPFREMLQAIRPKDGCPKCNSSQYGYHTIQRQDPTFVPETFELWICKNCNYQPFTDIRGLI